MATDKDDALIDAAFATARASDPPPSDDLVARILADADATQAAQHSASRQRSVGGGWRGLLGVIGGWRGASGLVAASLVGLAIGAALPASLSAVVPGAVAASYDLTDLGPSYEIVAEATE
ncbi:hypothetical protein [Tranquillimonas rosea]|uniref:hypothetical protein n=1 Tax=Tranquillimonas rosea TaxID=641238 RepID=UPI003BAA5473